jgi:hypothetical protein
MIALARLVSWLALAGSIVPALLFVKDRMTLDQAQLWMLVAAVAWFASAPLWMERKAEK